MSLFNNNFDNYYFYTIISNNVAAMMELVDMHDSNSCGSDTMRVQVPLAVQKRLECSSLLFYLNFFKFHGKNWLILCFVFINNFYRFTISKLG